jgi:hypothetical protein
MENKLTQSQLNLIYEIEAARANKLCAFRKKIKAAKKLRPLRLKLDF